MLSLALFGRRAKSLFSFVIAAALIAGLPSSAWACGACVSPPAPPGQTGNFPVLQDAERVLFYTDKKTGDSVVWIEVRYTGLASDFGWVVPVPKAPKVGVGSSLVFDLLDEATAARFPLKWSSNENCRQATKGCEYPDRGWSIMSAGGGGGSANESVQTADAGSSAYSRDQSSGVKVVDQGVTGPYNYAVVKAGSADPLLKWLDKHGYKVDKKAKDIVDSHIKKGDAFVAIKLSNGAGVNQIKPIVLRMKDAEPCVPLRLTSIAAVNDMSVVVTVAGQGRAIVKNHLDVKINPIKLDVLKNSANYGQVLSAAIDEAGGHAFVTEFSQPGAAMTLGQSLKWDTTGIAKSMDALAFARALNKSGATFLHPEAVALIDAHMDVVATFKAALTPVNRQWQTPLPVDTPAGVLSLMWTCGNFFNATGGEQCNFGGWSVRKSDLSQVPVKGPEIADALAKDFAGPIQDVLPAITANKQVSRLVLRIDPDEMDRDPIFAFNAALPNVDHVRQITARLACPSGYLPTTHTRITYGGDVGSWLFEGGSPSWRWQQAGTQLRPALDPRFAKAPFALSVTLQDETGTPQPIAKSDVELVDTAIMGAQIGQKSLPDGMVLKPASAWKPPASDQALTSVRYWCPPDSRCIPLEGWAPGKIPPGFAGAGTGPGASRCVHKQTRDDKVGGCSAAPNSQSADLGLLAVIVFSWVAVLRKRRIFGSFAA